MKAAFISWRLDLARAAMLAVATYRSIIATMRRGNGVNVAAKYPSLVQPISGFFVGRTVRSQ